MNECEFSHLMESVLQKCASERELAAFNAELQTRPARLSAFLDQVFTNTLLQTEGALIARQRRKASRRWVKLAAGLAVLLGGLAYAYYYYVSSQPAATVSAAAPAPAVVGVAAPVAATPVIPSVQPSAATLTNADAVSSAAAVSAVATSTKEKGTNTMSKAQSLAVAAVASLTLVQPTVSTATEDADDSPRFYAVGEVKPSFIETRCYLTVDLNDQTVNNIPPHATVYSFY